MPTSTSYPHFPYSIQTLPILLLLLLLLLFSRRYSALSPDGLSLLAFKSAVTSDPTSALADWDPDDADPCRWSGVSCANISGFSTPRVVAVAVSGKNLSGYIPSELGTLVFLRRLILHSNLLSGSVPPRLSNASSLHSLFLYSNNLTGELPPELCDLPRLQSLDFSHNSLSGEIQPGIRNCRQLQLLVLGNNRFSGEVPAGIWSELGSLTELDLSSNDFSGPIPPDLGEMKSMTGVMNLSHNRFSGEIPTVLGKLPAVVNLDLRNNDLSGKIPRTGALENQGAVSFLGNPHLCGVPLPIKCKYQAAPFSTGNQSVGRGGQSSSGEKVDRRKNLSTGLIIMISAADAVGVALISLMIVYIYWKVKDRGKGRGCTRTSKLGGNGGGRPSIRTLLCCSSPAGSNCDDEMASRTMTTLSEEEEQELRAAGGRLVAIDKGLALELEELLGASAYVLGKGGVGGMVYRVVLGNDGMVVAVRRLREGSGAAAAGGKYKEFASEAQAIGRVRHPNIVRLRAYYWSHDEKLIVSDYVTNGNLAAALRGRSSQPCLSWAMRLRIAKGTARGLAYLHECSRRKFVHGNIKPSNILLDDDFNPHISDFGLLRLVTIAGDSANIMGGSLPHVKHDPIDRPNNYRAPEARLLVSRATQKWDVYSFGVVLFELLTGRSPEFSVTPSQTSASSLPMEAGELVRWVRKGFDVEKPLAEMVDAAILKEGNVKKDVVSLLHVALACTETDPESRPKMTRVCDNLQKITC